MPLLRDTRAALRWSRARKKVDSAVQTLQKHGLSYSLADAKEKDSPIAGLIGSYGGVKKKDSKKIEAAAATLFGNSAAFFSTNEGRKRFDSNTAVQVGHFAPLREAFPEHIQAEAYQQSGRSMHLRASQKFLQRITFDPRLQAHPARKILGITAEESQEWSSLVESLWRSEKESKSWDEEEKNDYSQLSDMAFSDYIEKGEFFAVRRAYYDDDERITNISIQLFSPFQIRSPIFTGYNWISYTGQYDTSIGLVNALDYLGELPNGNYIEGGIEFDKKGREIAIFIAPVQLSDPWLRVPMKNSAGFQQVLHGFIQDEPGQKRGIPESSHAWHEFMNVKDLQLFELQSARLNSSISGTVTADSNAQPNGRTPMSELGVDRPGWGEVLPAQSELAPYAPPEYDVRDVNGGGFIVQNFTPGYKYTEHDTKRPNINIPEFIERMLEFVYPAMYGLSVTVVNQRLEGSYNASKGKLDLSWKQGVEYYLKQFSSDWHRPNYTAWLGGKVSTGEVPAAGWDNLRLRNAWTSMSIITPPKPSLNPLQEAKAGAERIKYLASNMELEAQQQTGTSAEENADRLAQENALLSDMMPEPVETEPVTEELDA